MGVALSFLRNFGIFSGASGVLGALSRGVASLGADQKSAEERAAVRQQRAIGSVGEGLAEGGDALAQGFYRGFTGLVTKPLQGARTGVGGALWVCLWFDSGSFHVRQCCNGTFSLPHQASLSSAGWLLLAGQSACSLATLWHIGRHLHEFRECWRGLRG